MALLLFMFVFGGEVFGYGSVARKRSGGIAGGQLGEFLLEVTSSIDQ